MPPHEKKNLLRNIHKARCFLWRQNNPEVNYSPTRISGGGVFLEEVSRSRKRDILLGKMDLREVGGGGDWMELAQGRDRWWALVNMVMNLRVP